MNRISCILTLPIRMPPLKSGIAFVVGLKICNVDVIALVNVHAAGPTELLPFGYELSLLIEYLDAAVGTAAT